MFVVLFDKVDVEFEVDVDVVAFEFDVTLLVQPSFGGALKWAFKIGDAKRGC